MYSNFPPSAAHLRRLEALGPDVQVRVAASEDDAIRHAPGSDVILGHRYLWQALPYTTRLRWVQSTAAGLDHVVCPDLFRLRPLLTRNPVFAGVVARHAHTLAWAVIRRVPEAVRAQAEGAWRRPLPMLGEPSSALILGMGGIGCEIGRLLRRDGIHVLGVARRASPDARAACDELVTTAEWRHRLSEMDLCFLALPLNPQTRDMLDEEALNALPPHAVVVNVGRGATMDITALCRSLDAGKLGGAALDVMEPVPPPDDPVWRTPGLLVTPKVASYHPTMQDELEAFIEGQVHLYLQGGAPEHSVDLEELPRTHGAAMEAE